MVPRSKVQTKFIQGHLTSTPFAFPDLSFTLKATSFISFSFILPLFLFESPYLFLHKKYTSYKFICYTVIFFFHLMVYSGDHTIAKYIKSFFVPFYKYVISSSIGKVFPLFPVFLLIIVSQYTVLCVHIICSLFYGQIPRNVISWPKWKMHSQGF